jgi:hypothetical protein
MFSQNLRGQISNPYTNQVLFMTNIKYSLILILLARPLGDWKLKDKEWVRIILDNE